MVIEQKWIQFNQVKMNGGIFRWKYGNIYHNSLYILLVSLFIGLFCFNTKTDESIFVKKIYIEIGDNINQINVSNFSDNDWRLSIKSFNVSDSNQIFIGGARTDKIKVFDSTGKYLRVINDHNSYSLFHSGNLFYGIRRSNINNKELIVFSDNDGSILFNVNLPFQEPLWTAFTIDGGKIYFSSKGIGVGEIRFYDINKNVFSNHENLQQYENKYLNDLNNNYSTLGYNNIGRVYDSIIFYNANCPYDNIKCIYTILAGTMINNKYEANKQIITENDIGYYIPDIPWILSKQRYIYTFGYIREGTEPSNKIIITCIDTYKLFPELRKPDMPSS